MARAGDLLGRREPERNEEEARLVDMAVVPVDDVDVHVVAVEPAAQSVRDRCAACSASENHDLRAHALLLLSDGYPGLAPASTRTSEMSRKRTAPSAALRRLTRQIGHIVTQSGATAASCATRFVATAAAFSG